MRIFKKADTPASCSFCGKSHTEVQRLISGPDGIFICESCTKICSDIMARELGSTKLVKFGDAHYNIDQLVAVTEVDGIPPMTREWDTPPVGKELLLQFAGGLSVRLPLSERERIEQLMLRGTPIV